MDAPPADPSGFGSPGAPPPGNPSSGGVKTWLVAGAVAIVVVIAVVVGVNLTDKPNNSQAATTGQANGNGATNGGGAGNGNGFRGGPGRGVSGTITAISDSAITISSAPRNFDGASGRGQPSNGQGSSSAQATTYTVKTTSSTTYTKTDVGSVSDLAKGDTVVVIGEDSNGTVAATRISQTDGADFGVGPQDRSGQNDDNGQTPMPPGGQGPGGQGQGGGFGQRPGGFTVGTISAVNGSTLTVTSQSGDSVTVTTTGDTTVSITKKIARSDLAKGDSIRVMGATSGTTVTATRVAVGDAAGFGGPARPGGTGALGESGRPGGPAGPDAPGSGPTGSSSAATTRMR